MGHSVSYYHHPTDTERHPAAGERRIDTSAWITPVNGIWTADDLTACGFAPVTATVRPVDTATHTTDRTIVVTAGEPVETWTVRPWTPAELADRTATATATATTSTIETRLRAALTGNATYLAITTPTNAQNTAQVKALTRQINALIRRQYTDLLADATGI